jgi:hypothetical protein
MQTRRLFLVFGISILLVGGAAFLAGRLLNQELDPTHLGAPFEGDFRSMIVPAPELPAVPPDVAGAFMERTDNAVLIETRTFEASGLVAASNMEDRSERGPIVEVVITGETMIYQETTQPEEPLSAENQAIYQTVQRSTLEDLDAHSMLMVWGRRSGDRVIADVLMYSDLVAVKSAIFEDCEICP